MALMSMSRASIVVFACALALFRTAYTAADKTVYQYVIFGDSVTDTGNVFRDGGVPDPAIYYKGRFTNGPNWVDYLKETISSKHKVQIFNYATGGGVACSANLNSTRYPYARDAMNQTGNFLADVARGAVPSGGKDTRRISLSWFAANDVTVALSRALTSGADTTTAGVQILTSLVTCLAQHVGALAAAGVSEVVLIPQSPVQVAPLVLDVLRPMVAQLVDAVDAALTQAVAAVNAQLEAAPAGSPASRAHVYLLGDSKWIGRIAPAVRPAFKYISDKPCFTNPDSSMVITPGIKVCEQPNDYAFYDEIHPSTNFHKWFALNGLLPRLQLFRLAPRDV